MFACILCILLYFLKMCMSSVEILIFNMALWWPTLNITICSCTFSVPTIIWGFNYKYIWIWNFLIFVLVCTKGRIIFGINFVSKMLVYLKQQCLFLPAAWPIFLLVLEHQCEILNCQQLDVDPVTSYFALICGAMC